MKLVGVCLVIALGKYPSLHAISATQHSIKY